MYEVLTLSMAEAQLNILAQINLTFLTSDLYHIYSHYYFLYYSALRDLFSLPIILQKEKR